jgi:hypothetical protein
VKDFDLTTIFITACEFFAPWYRPILFVAVLVVFVYAVALWRNRSLRALLRTGFVSAVVIAVLFAAAIFAFVPAMTSSSWSFVGGAIDLLFIGLIALGFGAAMFVAALPVTALFKKRAPS